MTRRKSVCLKWTLVLVLIIYCPYVYSRPQETSQIVVSSSSSSLDTDKSTENPIRYRYRDYNVKAKSYKSPLDISFIYRPNLGNDSRTSDSIKTAIGLTELLMSHNVKNSTVKHINHRLSRVMRKRYKNRNDSKHKTNNNKSAMNRPLKNVKDSINNDVKKRPSYIAGEKNLIAVTKERNKPVIKKVVTKWTDNAKYEDLDFSYESTTSNENNSNGIKFTNSFGYDRTENNGIKSDDLSDKRFPDKRYRPRPQYSEETQIYANNVQILDSYPFPSTRPPYIFNTPTPTPIITNVGYPQPWPQYQQQPVYQTIQTRPTTPKPIKIAKPINGPYNHHNNFENNYPQYPNFEVTTFQPTTAYTDRIVIRPEEYSASPDECPTIFLTLNNTFQGQGKEACPDLNIAVNTNVINKNVVIETEEETDTTLTDVFGLPLADDSESEESPQDYFDSAENQEEAESASVEATGLTNYNAANVAESSEPAGFESPSAALTTPNRPGRPNDNDDDSFGLSSILSFFKPAINAFAWLATINPFSFGLLSILLAPLVLLVAGTSGIAALVAPWALSYGREAPKVVHVYRPEWQWDSEYKAWQLNSFPDRQWYPTSPRSNENQTMRSTIRATWFYKLKELMQAATRRLNALKTTVHVQNSRKNKRKKRETWAIRVK